MQLICIPPTGSALGIKGSQPFSHSHDNEPWEPYSVCLGVIPKTMAAVAGAYSVERTWYEYKKTMTEEIHVDS